MIRRRWGRYDAPLKSGRLERPVVSCEVPRHWRANLAYIRAIKDNIAALFTIGMIKIANSMVERFMGARVRGGNDLIVNRRVIKEPSFFRHDIMLTASYLLLVCSARQREKVNCQKQESTFRNKTTSLDRTRDRCSSGWLS